MIILLANDPSSLSNKLFSVSIHCGTTVADGLYRAKSKCNEKVSKSEAKHGNLHGLNDF